MNNIVPGEGVKVLAVVSLDGNSKEKTVTYTFFSRFLSGVVGGVDWLVASYVVDQCMALYFLN